MAFNGDLFIIEAFTSDVGFCEGFFNEMGMMFELRSQKLERGLIAKRVKKGKEGCGKRLH